MLSLDIFYPICDLRFGFKVIAYITFAPGALRTVVGRDFRLQP